MRKTEQMIQPLPSTKISTCPDVSPRVTNIPLQLFFATAPFKSVHSCQMQKLYLPGRSPKFQNSLGSQNFLRWESENPVVRKSDFHRCHQHKKQSTKVKNMNTYVIISRVRPLVQHINLKSHIVFISPLQL